MIRKEKTATYFYTATVILALLMSGWILPTTGIISNTAFAGNEDLTKQTEVTPQEFGNIPVYFEENRDNSTNV